MRSKSNKIQFIALAFVMLFSVMNAWGIGLFQKEIYCLEHENLKMTREGDNCTWTGGTKRTATQPEKPGVFKWTGSTNNLVRFGSLTWGHQDLRSYDRIIVKTSSLSQGAIYRIVINSTINGRDYVFSYLIDKSGLVSIPLDNVANWYLNYNSPHSFSMDQILKDVQKIKIGGFSATGTLEFEDIALAKKIRDVEWDGNGHITLSPYDFPAQISNDFSRNGDYFHYTGKGYLNITVGFDTELEINSFYVKGSSYDSSGKRHYESDYDTPFLSGFVPVDLTGYHYISNKFNTDIVYNKMSDLEIVYNKAGDMHVDEIVIRHKNVKIVSFDSNGGSACETIEAYNSSITLPSPVLAYHRFEGWYNGETKVGNAGDSYTPTANVTLVARWSNSEQPIANVGNWNKDSEINTVFTPSYKIANNHQRVFTFKNNRNSTLYGVMTANWSLWTSNQACEVETKSNYFHLDMAPSAQRYETPESLVVQSNKFYKRTGDNLDVLVPMTPSMYPDFLYDMCYGAEVKVVVGNYDGKIRVYAVMTYADNNTNLTRSYVYPYDYTKYVVNGTTTGDIYAYFTVDHTILTDFSASVEMPLALIDYHIQYPDNTKDIDKSCTVTMATEEGYPLVPGTKVGLNDKVVYKANTGLGWKFKCWGSLTYLTDSRRTVQITPDHIAKGVADPTATFSKNGNAFTFATNRLFHLDFEDVDNDKLLDQTMIAEYENDPPAQLQGKFYNYGGKGRIYKDPVFGNYYQNLAVGVDEYQESKSENFLRYVFTDEDKIRFDQNLKSNGATIGFWVNGKLAVDYELPLERGSMFALFSNQRFEKANQEPRYMFDISCNGWIYSYMPKSYVSETEFETDENGNKVGKLIHKTNKYFYGEDSPVVENPKPSLFGEQNYKHTQDQRQHKFYDDRNWHYVTYVATEDFKYVTIYLDGVKTGELDTRNLGDKYSEFDEDGDYKGRVFYLRNLVLGGFTPHGMFFSKQYYSDAALAYDDISIYSGALTSYQIKAIYDEKMKDKPRYEWHFVDELKSNNDVHMVELNDWQGLGLDQYKKTIPTTQAQALTSNNTEISATEGLRFTGDVVIDRQNGLLGLKKGARVYLGQVPWHYNARFVVKSMDGTYSKQEFLYPISGYFFKAGLQKYDKEGMEDFFVDISPYGYNNNNVDKYFYANETDVWISDIIITPYEMVFSHGKTQVANHDVAHNPRWKACDEVQIKVDNSDPQKVRYMNRTGNEYDDNAWSNRWSDKPVLPKFYYYYKYDESTTPNFVDDGINPYVKFTSSAPLVATVSKNGTVTLTGVPGEAVIKAELIQHNLQDGLIFDSYKIVVTDETNTNRLVANSTVGVGTVHTTANTNSNVVVMTGGWAYNDGSYKSGANDVTDGWGNVSYNYGAANDPNPVDGFTVVAQGQQDAHSESYGLNSGDGRFIPATSQSPGLNQKPWTLPCRGSYIKVQPQKAGVMSVYVLQNGNLGNETGEGDAKHCTTVNWRPVYVADETGRVLTDIYVTSNSKISQNDNFFKEGRRRAQFIETEHATWNQQLESSLNTMLTSYPTRFRTLIDNWSNAGWKQRIIPSGDGGHMIMSKGIVRYTFNVYPGKTYYIFSNDTKVGYSGYNFEEGKHLTKNSSGVYSLTNVSSTSTPITFEDAVNGTSVNGKTYNQPSFPYNKVTKVTYNRTFTSGVWGSICLPFSMNNKQMKENFGDETAVVLLKEIDSEGVVQMVWHVNQDIIAGYPYFILPRGKVKGADVTSITQINTNAYFDPDVTAPSFMVGPKMKNSQSATVSSVDELGYTTSYPYVFTGNFATETATAGSYVMLTSGVLTKVSNTPSIKPFRAYLRYCEKLDPTKNTTDPLIDGVAEVKPLSGMGYKNTEGEETTTSVEQILEANGIFIDSANVYGVDGQVKRYNTHDMQGLPKGVYIVNGKKYVVK